MGILGVTVSDRVKWRLSEGAPATPASGFPEGMEVERGRED